MSTPAHRQSSGSTSCRELWRYSPQAARVNLDTLFVMPPDELALDQGYRMFPKCMAV